MPSSDSAEIIAAQILDGWRQIERDDRTFAYEVALSEYLEMAVMGSELPSTADVVGPGTRVHIARTVALTVDGQRFVTRLEGPWPPMEPDGPLLENCLYASACDGREHREFLMVPQGPVTAMGSFSKRATPDNDSYLTETISPLWLAHRPLALLAAMGFDVGGATAIQRAEGDSEIVVPGNTPRFKARVRVSPAAPFRPIALQVERNGRPQHVVELLLQPDADESFPITGWKDKRFNDGVIASLTNGKVTTFTASPEINDSTFTLKFPLGAHIVGRTDDEAARTYWIQGVNNELRPLPREQYGRLP